MITYKKKVIKIDQVVMMMMMVMIGEQMDYQSELQLKLDMIRRIID